MNNGFADLGYMLAGGVRRDAQAEYLPQLKKNYDVMSAYEAAKIKRSQVVARESLAASMQKQGFSDLEANVLLSGETVDVRRLGDWGNPNYFPAQQAARAASGIDGGAPKLGQMSTAQSLASGTPLKTVAIDDGFKINPYDPEADIEMTDIGKANLGAINARAGASNASAANSNASAAETNWELGEKRGGRPTSFNDKGGAGDGAKNADILRAAREKLAQINRMVVTAGHTEKEAEAFRESKRQDVYKRLRNAGYNKIANELGGGE